MGSPFAARSGPVSVTVEPSAMLAHVTNLNSNNFSAFTINASTGTLTEVSGSPFATGSDPISVITTGKIQ